MRYLGLLLLLACHDATAPSPEILLNTGHDGASLNCTALWATRLPGTDSLWATVDTFPEVLAGTGTSIRWDGPDASGFKLTTYRWRIMNGTDTGRRVTLACGQSYSGPA